MRWKSPFTFSFMKFLHHQTVGLCLGVLLLVPWLGGCGGEGGNPGANVNVAAEIQKLSSQTPEDRQNACAALGDAKEKAVSAVKPLITALKDKDDLVRRLAAYALGEIGPKAKEAIPALKEAMQDRDITVVQAAIRAIQVIDPTQKIDGVMAPNVTN
jgi:HEAT repeats